MRHYHHLFPSQLRMFFQSSAVTSPVFQLLQPSMFCEFPIVLRQVVFDLATLKQKGLEATSLFTVICNLLTYENLKIKFTVLFHSSNNNKNFASGSLIVLRVFVCLVKLDTQRRKQLISCVCYLDRHVL